MYQPIEVHEKALGHLTRGLYRSPASAIRELISNAWDANASQVVIETARPTFHRLQVTDDV
jgi:HSP90 family molecular chaperone